MKKGMICFIMMFFVIMLTACKNEIKKPYKIEKSKITFTQEEKKLVRIYPLDLGRNLVVYSIEEQFLLKFKIVDETGDIIYETSDINHAKLIDITKDGIIYHHYNTDGTSQTVKIDINGEVVWSFPGLLTRFDGPDYNTRNGESIGHIRMNDDQNYIIKLDQDGNVLWQHGPYKQMYFLEYNDGDYFYVYENDIYPRSGIIYKFNEEGDVSQLNLDELGSYSFSNGMIFVATHNTISKYDPNFNLKYQYNLDKYATINLYVDANHQVYAHLMNVTNVNGNNCTLLLKLDANGNKVYEHYINEYSHQPIEIRILTEGYVLYSETKTITDEFDDINHKTFYNILDTNGNRVNRIEYSGYNYVLEGFNNGDFLLQHTENNQHYLSLIDKTGNVKEKHGPYIVLQQFELREYLIFYYQTSSHVGILRVDPNGNMRILSLDEYTPFNNNANYIKTYHKENIIGYRTGESSMNYYKLDVNGTVMGQYLNYPMVEKIVFDHKQAYLLKEQLVKVDEVGKNKYSADLNGIYERTHLLKNDFVAVVTFKDQYELLILNQDGKKQIKVNPIASQLLNDELIYYFIDNGVLKQMTLDLKQ